MVIFLVGGACLCIAAGLIYLQLPRATRTPPAWLRSESGSTAAALGSFILLVTGISLIIKAVA